MSTTIEQTIDAPPELAAAIRHAADLLKTLVGDTILTATAHWRVIRDEADRPVVELVLTDASHDIAETTVTGRLAPNELKDQYRLQRRLSRLWDDLLREVSQRRLRRIR